MGNVITFAVVIITLVVYRLTDRRNRNLQAARNYGKQLKEQLYAELNEYIDKKKNEITNYRALLATDKSAVKALLASLAAKTGEFDRRTANIGEINERLGSYDGVLAELFKMTERVEDNLRRIAAESAFVEDVALHVEGAKEQFDALLAGIGDCKGAIERSASDSLARISTEIADGKARLESALRVQQEEFDRRVAEQKTLVGNLLDSQREKIEKTAAVEEAKISAAEAERAANVERDTKLITAMLKEAVDHAGERAGKLEDEIYDEFRKQTQERSERIKTDLDGALAALRESAQTDINALDKAIESSLSALRDNAHNEVNALDKAIEGELRDLRADADALRGKSAELDALERKVRDGIDAIEGALRSCKNDADKTTAALARDAARLAEEAKTAALTAANEKFKEYKSAEEAIRTQIAQGIETAKAMDAEARLQLESAQENIKKQIAAYEAETALVAEKSTAEFNAALDILKIKLRDIESEIEKIKNAAYERSEENFKLFEDNFAASLQRRGDQFENRFTELRDNLQDRLEAILAIQETECRKIETGFNESLRRKAADLDAKFIQELERIKTAAESVEEGARKQMEDAEETLTALKEQVKNDFAELRESSLAAFNTEIGRSALESADKFKSYAREIENEQKEIRARIEEKNSEMSALLLKSRKEADDALGAFSSDVKEISSHIEELRRRGRDALGESDEKISALRASIDDIHHELTRYKEQLLSGADEKTKHLETSVVEAEEKIADFFNRSKVIDKTMEMKNALSRNIEDMQGDLQRLELQKADLDNLESQFAKIKRMEDEVNAKMTRFLTEQRRVDLMEEDFKKLLQTAASVNLKLSELSSNDDTLQELQARFMKLSGLMNETEEKLQRIEKKNQILDVTNEGIDKNFRALQESEKTAKQFEATIGHLSSELTEMKAAVENLTRENAKVLETSEKLTLLDAALHEIEERTAALQKARQWCADLEGRINTIYAEAKDLVKVAGELLKKEGIKGLGEAGAPTLSQREQIINLTRQGWSSKEIANTLKIAQSAVELILEMAPRGKA